MIIAKVPPKFGKFEGVPDRRTAPDALQVLPYGPNVRRKPLSQANPVSVEIDNQTSTVSVVLHESL